MDEGLIRFKKIIFVTKNFELNRLIIREFHAKQYYANSRYQKSLMAIKMFYYLGHLKRKVVDFVAKSIECQQVKVECKHLAGLLQTIPILEWKWKVISMDFITMFPRTSILHNAIMVVIGKLSKVAHFVVVNSTNYASEVAKIFLKGIVRLHGIPKKIILDRDAKFTLKIWKELFASLGIELSFSTTYHCWKIKVLIYYS